MALAALPPTLPRRDPQSRALLDSVARRVRPVVPAGEQMVPVPDPLGALLPGGGVRRGGVVTVASTAGGGAGATTVALHLAAAATTAGEWVAAVDLDGSLGGLAALEAGVAVGRFAVARRVPPDRWAMVTAALLDGVGFVLAEMPPAVRSADAHRLAARARERGAVFVVVAPWGATRWPADAALRITATATRWEGLEPGAGLLGERSVEVRVDGRGAAARRRVAALALTG